MIKNKIVGILVVIVLIIAGIIGWFFFQKAKNLSEKEFGATATPSAEEKKALEDATAPEGSSEMNSKELEKILDSLSVPQK